VRCDLGALRATLLCRFAYDLAHFGSELALLLPPGRSRAAADSPAQPDQGLPASHHPTIEVGARHVQHCLLITRAIGGNGCAQIFRTGCTGPCLN
jgi:hypothetical protein